MHPPLLKPTTGRRQNERFKGCTEGSTTKRKGSHQCKVCKNYGHRWYKCKDGDPDDIAAMLAEKWASYSFPIFGLLSILLHFSLINSLLLMHNRGPPKKRKTNVAPPCESSIVPVGPKIMYFPPRYDLHTYILILCNTFSFNLNLTYLYYYSRSTSVTLGSGNSVR